MMHRFVVLGSGRMGAAVAVDLARAGGSSDVLVVDRDPAAVAAALKAAATTGLEPHRVRGAVVDVADASAVSEVLAGFDVAVSAVPYDLNPELTRAAIATRTHLVDLGGNPDVVRRQHGLSVAARDADVAVVPDCGLAPGLANVIAGHLVRSMAAPHSAHIRVGGLPQEPRGQLGYGLLFSVHGLVNEYREPAEALREGRRVWLPSLSEVESIAFGGMPGLEAFTTSGGTGTMCSSFEEILERLDYKTIRYAGHADRMRLLFDLGFLDDVEVAPGLTRRDVNEAALEDGLGEAGADITLMRITVRGRDEAGRDIVATAEIVDRHDGVWTSMQRLTAWPASITALQLADGRISERGVLRNEIDVPWPGLEAELARRGVRVAVTEAHDGS